MKFKIEYIDPKEDPKDSEWKEILIEFEDTSKVTAKEWAEDYAYALSDKGTYKVSIVNKIHHRVD